MRLSCSGAIAGKSLIIEEVIKAANSDVWFWEFITVFKFNRNWINWGYLLRIKI